MKSVMTVVGARPQFVKASVLSRAVRAAGMHETIVHTGQHYDDNLSQRFFDELEIPAPDVNLNVGSGSHARQTGAIMERFENVLTEQERPDVVLVFGDTNSTIAAAVTARKLHVLVAHVEAGLRSFNRRMPEEINRIVTDRLSDFLFCPTPTALDHLRREGLKSRAYLTGDVMRDAAQYFAQRPPPDGVHIPNAPYYLATVHRAENTDDPVRLAGIVRGLGRLEDPVVFPIHPRTRIRLSGLALPDNVRPVEPQSYVAMLHLIRGAERVLTDSGGLQKEALWLSTPCVTMRDETEWKETLSGNWNVLTGADPDAIENAVSLDPVGPSPDLGAPPQTGMASATTASGCIAGILSEA